MTQSKADLELVVLGLTEMNNDLQLQNTEMKQRIVCLDTLLNDRLSDLVKVAKERDENRAVLEAAKEETAVAIDRYLRLELIQNVLSQQIDLLVGEMRRMKAANEKAVQASARIGSSAAYFPG